MTEIALDIGAGGTTFARRFCKLNKEADFMYLCGEPDYRNPWRLSKLLARPRHRKIVKIKAEYADFRLPDQSLTMVSLNAYHMFIPPSGIQDELVRCLKPGGLFFSAHPIGMHPKIPLDYFAPIGFGWNEELTHCEKEALSFHRTALPYHHGAVHMTYGWRSAEDNEIKRSNVLHYPASPVIQNRLEYGMHCRKDWYIYANMPNRPSLKIWLRI